MEQEKPPKPPLPNVGDRLLIVTRSSNSLLIAAVTRISRDEQCWWAEHEFDFDGDFEHHDGLEWWGPDRVSWRRVVNISTGEELQSEAG